jgi:signal transduction histidine kinase
MSVLNPAPLEDENARREELAVRLAWLVNLRWIALALVLCAIMLVQILGLIRSPWPLELTVVVMILANASFHYAQRWRAQRSLRSLTAEALSQITLDIIGLGILVFFAGGLANPFIFYFTFHVVIASILLETKQAYVVAGFTTFVIATLGFLDYWGGLGSWPLQGPLHTEQQNTLSRLEKLFVTGTTFFFSAYFVTSIMETLRGRTREVRQLNADLAERVQRLAAAERLLSAEHDRARAIVECMEEGVVVVDVNGKLILANSAAEEFAHSDLPELLSQARAGSDPLNTGAPAEFDHDFQGRLFEITVSPVRLRTGENGAEPIGLVVVSRDVTERRSLEKQVLHAEKLHAAGSLAAGVAHELNTPLGTILGYAQMLLEDVTRGGATAYTKDLHAIEDQARRCRQIVQGMLDFARKSGGERETLAPGEIATKAIDLTAASLALRTIKVQLAPLPENLPLVKAARNELEQVLVNLITNAADAIDDARTCAALKDKPQGVVELSVALDSRTGQVFWAVEDDGPGVPQDLLSNIFEPFFTTKVAGRGTGLGLSIARRVAEDHGGELMVRKRVDGKTGARFELRLPAAEIPKRVSNRLLNLPELNKSAS